MFHGLLRFLKVDGTFSKCQHSYESSTFVLLAWNCGKRVEHYERFLSWDSVYTCFLGPKRRLISRAGTLLLLHWTFFSCIKASLAIEIVTVCAMTLTIIADRVPVYHIETVKLISKSSQALKMYASRRSPNLVGPLGFKTWAICFVSLLFWSFLLPISLIAQLLSSEKDMLDVLGFGKKDTILSPRKYSVSVVPAAGYTLQTGFAGILSGNVAFQNGEKNSLARVSSVSTSITYSQFNQTIVPFLVNYWSKGNMYNFISDNRYIQYPSDIFGLGGRTDPNQGLTIDFTSVKLHQTILKKLTNDFYVGLGFYYDQFWDIKSLDSLRTPVLRRFSSTVGSNEIAVGPVLKLTYDNRDNPINPIHGTYGGITLRQSVQSLGSTNKWTSLLLEFRGYFPFPRNSKNILAVWDMEWLSPYGSPPYLLKPSTGWDDQYNTGRGYIQGRFRGNNMHYFESEYRFQLTHNGLLGGVAFVNFQRFTGEISQEFSSFTPGYGLGLRLKVNKNSRTNLCIDYGFGKNGSRGFFVNLGEVF